jgi:predicted secreted protein
MIPDRCPEDLARPADRTPTAMRAWSGLALSLSFALLVACGSAPKEKPPVKPSVVEKPGQKSITVSDANELAHVFLESHQTLVVSLPLTATQGREWSLVDLKPGVLAASGPKFERESLDVNWNDAEGFSVWRFKPEAPGTVGLRFELRRPRELQPAVRTLTYTVTVK